MAISVHQLSQTFFAEILGVDLSQPIDDESFKEILDAFHKYSVVVFRDQKISSEHHIAFSRRFGDLEIHMLKSSLLPGYDEILVVSNIEEDGPPKGAYSAGQFWHSDLSYKECPSLASLLHAIEVPTEGIGDTEFADLTAAYNALSEEMKQQIDGLKSVHRYRSYGARANDKATGSGITKVDELTDNPDLKHAQDQVHIQDMAHPIVRTHPATGRKALYVNEGLCVAIPGLPEDESTALLKELFEHSTRPDFIYRHRWRIDDIVMWDNRCIIHRATPINSSVRRVMHRTTVRGDKPF